MLDYIWQDPALRKNWSFQERVYSWHQRSFSLEVTSLISIVYTFIRLIDATIRFAQVIVFVPE